MPVLDNNLSGSVNGFR